MNLIEAIKSGKRFKRTKNPDWIDQRDVVNWYCSVDFPSLMADDWEVEHEPIKVAEYQFYSAYAKALNKVMTSAPGAEVVDSVDRAWKEVAEELWAQLNK